MKLKLSHNTFLLLTIILHSKSSLPEYVRVEQPWTCCFTKDMPQGRETYSDGDINGYFRGWYGTKIEEVTEKHQNTLDKGCGASSWINWNKLTLILPTKKWKALLWFLIRNKIEVTWVGMRPDGRWNSKLDGSWQKQRKSLDIK